MLTPEQLLQFPHPILPAPGETLEVAPGVHWVRMPLPYALDHINLWMLEDACGWVIVDCGMGNDATRALWQRVFSSRLNGRSVSRVIVTHHHPDHAGNAGWLTQRFDVPMLMSQSEYLTTHAARDGTAGHARDDIIGMFRRNGLQEAQAGRLLRRGNAYRNVVPDFPLYYKRLWDGEAIGVGGRDWRVVMGYGHAPEHAALYCESLGVLISGDMVLPKITTNVSVPSSQPNANPLKLYLASITRYARLPADTLVLPSHGLPFRGMRERVEQLKEHHRLRLAELQEVCDTPKSAFEVLGTLFRRELDGHQMFFAMGEAMAHMHYLHEHGSLQLTDGDGVIRYVRS